MKKLLLISALSAIALTGCRSDDDQPLPTTIPNATVGVWNPSSFKVYSGTDHTTLLSTTAANACYQLSIFEFLANGNVVTTLSDLDISGICQVSTPETLPYTYNAQAKTLTVDDEVMRVKTLTANVFEFEVGDYLNDDNNDGVQDIMYITLVR